MKAIFIHANNSELNSNDNFMEKIYFTYNIHELDEKFAEELLPKLKSIDFDIIFIRDTLSDNYMDFTGITVAYHIRFSEELGEKQFCPIIILSDLDIYTILKLAPLNKILLTTRTVLGRDNIGTFDFFCKYFNEFGKLDATNFKEEFLDKINVPIPDDYEDHHSIANEWSIAKWSTTIGVDSEAIKKVSARIKNSLYFKFEKTKNNVETHELDNSLITFKPKDSGKILYIDDEYSKGWGGYFK